MPTIPIYITVGKVLMRYLLYLSTILRKTIKETSIDLIYYEFGKNFHFVCELHEGT